MDKDRILDEIRRCAADNGGKPLGRSRFRAVTGIHDAEWLGRYWARWGDAVAEAGFQPNELQGVIYSNDDLVRLLGALARELGHFPTTAEVQLRSRQDANFPSHNTFERLGNKRTRAMLLEALLRNDPDSEAVRESCAAITSKSPKVEPTSPVTPIKGFVYLQRSGKHFKIGHTNHVGRRDYEINLLLPQATELVHYFETDDPKGIEGYWHRRFADKRVRGEWFSLTKPDVAAFKRRRNFM